MKKYIFAAVLYLATLCATHAYKFKTSAEVRKIRDKCVADMNLTSRIEEYTNAQDIPDDEETQCLLKCILTKIGIFNAKTGFNVQYAHEQVLGKIEGIIDTNKDLLDKIKACVDNNEQGSSVCEWAYRGGSCIIKLEVAAPPPRI